MQETHHHNAPALTMGASLVAFISTNPTQILALLFALVGAAATLIRLVWDYEDRRDRKRAQARPAPAPRP